ncbi:plasmid mobilization protein, partial [Sinorhizobium meliloti]
MDDGKFNVLLEPAKKDRTLHARVTADEHAAIERAAEGAGMTVSSFFRSLNLEGAGVRPMLTGDDRLVMAALLEDMRMIGINLNQVARALNSGR